MAHNLNIRDVFTYPYQNNILLRKQKYIKRQLLARENISYIPKKIAILAGSTVDEIRNILELFLLQSGINPQFYQSEYNKFYEDAVFENEQLDKFAPEIIIVFTTSANIVNIPDVDDNDTLVQEKIKAEMSRFTEIWRKLSVKYHAVIIQNNFDLPPTNDIGSLSATLPVGIHRFIAALNEEFAAYINRHNNFFLHDMYGLSAKIGLTNWHNSLQYHAYKFAVNYDVMPDVSLGLAKIIYGITGKTKKCLVLDLDNTLWGGVIGDDGVEGIQLGHETPAAEAYTAWQEYVLKLRKRGVILAVCSKNDEEVAKSGFSHPDSILSIDDFVAFHANWKPKNINIEVIAKEINIGLDSLVFIDDNPAEREIVRQTLPEVAVPEVDASDVYSFIKAIEGAGYFEPISISEDDYKRNETYKANKARQKLSASAASYDDFLKSLNMTAEIDAFRPVYLDRIAQLTGKTNQFNLTTRRYTRAEIESIAVDDRFVALYGRLMDKFGDNGLISVVIGEKRGEELHILLWLMSCRVLKRGMEENMLDALVARAKVNGCTKLIGYYYPTKKNKMVEGMYASFGFTSAGTDGEGTVWKLPLAGYVRQGKYIEVKGAEQ